MPAHIIYYGDEIGRANNIFLGDRDGVRTPCSGVRTAMPVSPRGSPAWLSAADHGSDLRLRSRQCRSAAARAVPLFLTGQTMLSIRKTSQGFGPRRLSFSGPATASLAYLRELGTRRSCFVANLARSAQHRSNSTWRAFAVAAGGLMGRTSFPTIGDLPYMLTLPAHGFYWFRLAVTWLCRGARGTAGARGSAGARPVRRLDEPVP